MSVIDDELQKIIDHSFHLLEKELNSNGAYDPFAITINKEGEIIPFTYVKEKGIEFDVDQIIDELDAVLDKQIGDKEIKAYGIGYDAQVEINEEGDLSNALVLDLIHEEDGAVPFYFFPYELKNGKAEFGESFGIEK